MTITFKAFALSQIECAVLNDSKGNYTSNEISDLLECSAEDYAFEYGLEIPKQDGVLFDEVKEMLHKMQITVNE